jgi:type I pantothenate kinase
MSLSAEGLDAVRGLGDPIQLGEVEDIYLPLSRLLRLYFEASTGLRETVGTFLGQRIRPVPFIIAVADSVAVGKSTTAQQVRAGAPEVTAPVYSHVAYDIVAGQRQSVRRPDVLILEGINVLQPAPPGALTLADFFDFSVYVDARADHIRHWFLSRLHALRETAFTDPQSPFRSLTQVSPAEVDAFGTLVWKTINEVNLIENIQPTRARATLVLHKEADHSVTRVRLRRF